jgi:DNA-binding Xre family transcriptional regulator
MSSILIEITCKKAGSCCNTIVLIYNGEKEKQMAYVVNNRLFELIKQKELKEGRNITLTELAEDIGVSVQLIGRWLNKENPVERFDAQVIVKICTYFGVDIADLLYLEFEED